MNSYFLVLVKLSFIAVMQISFAVYFVSKLVQDFQHQDGNLKHLKIRKSPWGCAQ